MLAIGVAKETYRFPLANVVSDCLDRVIIQPKQRIQDLQKRGVRTRARHVLRLGQ
jgi:hypothetical protein